MAYHPCSAQPRSPQWPPALPPCRLVPPKVHARPLPQLPRVREGLLPHLRGKAAASEGECRGATLRRAPCHCLDLLPHNPPRRGPLSAHIPSRLLTPSLLGSASPQNNQRRRINSSHALAAVPVPMAGDPVSSTAEASEILLLMKGGARPSHRLGCALCVSHKASVFVLVGIAGIMRTARPRRHQGAHSEASLARPLLMLRCCRPTALLSPQCNLMSRSACLEGCATRHLCYLALVPPLH